MGLAFAFGWTTCIGPVLGGLRFDPINSTVPTYVSWIAVELLH